MRRIYILILAVGLMLMVGGIITGKHGATVIGMIIAAVNVHQWMRLKKQGDQPKSGDSVNWPTPMK